MRYHDEGGLAWELPGAYEKCAYATHRWVVAQPVIQVVTPG